jgi:2-polyprenyl-3-methyl-5-hydroxy-6-metoxy-1,4-benzoquinol methylase
MSDYKYTSEDSELAGYAGKFHSRIGTNGGNHEADYFETVQMLAAIYRDGSLLDIGAGVGRLTGLVSGVIKETVALEPDRGRWEICRKAMSDTPHCEVLNMTTTGYIEENPGKKFDVVVIGMVLQHLSTSACQQLLKESASLLTDKGVCVVFTTHAIQETRGFSYAKADADERYIDVEDFDRYASDHRLQLKGLPVRRFSKAELLDCMGAYFNVILWRPTSFYGDEIRPWFAKRLGVSPDELKDVGNSQFVVAQRREVVG